MIWKALPLTEISMLPPSYCFSCTHAHATRRTHGERFGSAVQAKETLRENRG